MKLLKIHHVAIICSDYEKRKVLLAFIPIPPQ
ncbi:hypothetical protein J2Y67_001292 [Neobacillus niacini]|nr:hypothetical protein [Neobacillus niacini]